MRGAHAESLGGAVLRVVLGYAAASFAGALSMIAMALISSAATSDPEMPALALGSVISAPFVAFFAGWFAIVPGAIAVAVAGIFAMQRWWFFAFAGIGAAAWFLYLAASDGGGKTHRPSEMLILAAGLVSGVAYRFAAGRSSGNRREGGR